MALVFACSGCKTPLSLNDPKSEVMLVCPICGLADSLDNVEREVAEFLQEELANAFDDMRRNVTSGGHAFAFDETPRTRLAFRFIAIPQRGRPPT